jgi:hypothetical protein
MKEEASREAVLCHRLDSSEYPVATPRGTAPHLMHHHSKSLKKGWLWSSPL